MIVTIFRSRLRPDNLDAYHAVADEMAELVQAMPGLVSFKTFQAEDGERVTLAEFETEESQDAWRNHPRHRTAQKLGASDFYSQYRVQVCSLLRESRFPDEV
jgi:heme-degrading monooxygenase HmoA